ncbi:SGNH/GDSL hydrolase family protein [Actinokineospora spheciospongiae]|uniref:SGNH/GDSL hydrolase family protein n=1 Tax=Actinokineospora spheciospongiae TaxID=909613 RepID=UPI000D70B154|nr:SGNH/GDSL hydrolase family protein [Actinokineospora spheciospongiae]PWW65450.1 lysophospholipase L1-like esterase [Actinokineospora spheciospongiae]
MSRRLLVTAAAAMIAAAGTFAVTTSANAADPINYVALGDSYSAASGVSPSAPGAPSQCLRSALNYPTLIAQATGANVVDVTCGAAQTSHFTTSQYPGLAPQVDALSADTDVVTMTIGGNDSGIFIRAAATCALAGFFSGGKGSPCKDGNGSSFEDTVRNTTYPDLVKALTAVRDKAPNAKIGIIGYPWIVPATGGCFDKIPVATGDVPYMRSLQATLNDAIGRAAAATGVTYVDINQLADGHDVCAAPGVRWIEPPINAQNSIFAHPNALGEREMAAAAMAALNLN